MAPDTRARQMESGLDEGAGPLPLALAASEAPCRPRQVPPVGTSDTDLQNLLARCRAVETTRVKSDQPSKATRRRLANPHQPEKPRASGRLASCISSSDLLLSDSVLLVLFVRLVCSGIPATAYPSFSLKRRPRIPFPLPLSPQSLSIVIQRRTLLLLQPLISSVTRCPPTQGLNTTQWRPRDRSPPSRRYGHLSSAALAPAVITTMSRAVTGMFCSPPRRRTRVSDKMS